MFDIEYYRDNPPTISLMVLGLHCNFRCDHCMYDCSPEEPIVMFSNENLLKVQDMVNTLVEHDVHPTINLVGGEPTADLDEFKRVLDRVMRWGVEVEMTTNGWWVGNVETARRFFEIVKPYIYGESREDCGPCGFSIRVSNDPYHDQFRKTRYRGKRLNAYVEDLFDRDEDGVFYERTMYCSECGEDIEEEPCPNDCSDHVAFEEEDGVWWCEDCNRKVDSEHTNYHDIDYDEREIMDRPIAPSSDCGWLYVQNTEYQKSEYVIPNGRGANIGSNGDGCSSYSNCNKLSFMPDGQLMDICCKGSWCEFGTLDDDPFVLLELGRKFAETMKPNCWTCGDAVVEWSEKHLEREREGLVKERWSDI